ncbi:E3 ubiquitin/ISG15 ligase TRIM25-like [Triplophysa dalaica]|uniref:E3 ubiquitin/ISG15 ligase TRIM25-like n=1 Tax=Triplophysa dalaica TaxID=1582913 RepID=UPI0024DF8FA4|nr:E3 ubiquitin/ISG15 ligase TRIM25-like [Triplophysa dalaica]XP_056603569.1 E3 ubiquitin/ISG15 ligase TRIM25-like [Triplophysa dalaica]XP_056603570.1 E3 ubiquitin/ISG15 ligase TRIM25-like [Triplophysa dalaica]
MAESSISVSPALLNCSVCLDLLKDPVTVPCGHSYCMKCITDYWNQAEKKVCSCPQCRQTFSPRPALNKNPILAEMVEIKSQAEDVDCDVCTGRKHKAIRSCLECQTSYCQNHLEQHENFHSGKRDKDATRGPDMICPVHGKMKDVKCWTGQLLVCPYCKLKEIQRQRIQKREKELHELRAGVESYKRSSQTAVEDCEVIFTELISYFEKSRSEVTQLIRDQEKAALSQAERVLKQLKQEIDDLKKKDAELEQLSCMDDHQQFQQSFQSLFAPPESSDSPIITFSPLLSFDYVESSVSQLREKLEHFCREELEKLSDKVKYTETIPSPDPNNREPFLQYSHQLTLDPNTLNERLRQSEGDRVVTYTTGARQYSDHPDRFNSLLQVLCRESVCGRSYWEVEWSVKVGISVSYKSISRKGRGNECEFGRNDKSWSLSCSDSSCSFWHNNVETKLPVVSRSARIGVYVGHNEGTLSFFNVSDTMTLIHSINTTFTQPLYPGFRLSLNGKVTLCDLTM